MSETGRARRDGQRGNPSLTLPALVREVQFTIAIFTAAQTNAIPQAGNDPQRM
jgi:hypothetical protein